MDYKQPDMCKWMSPLASAQANTHLYQHLITPQELIQLMTPPLYFPERKCMMFNLYGGTLLLVGISFVWGMIHKVKPGEKKVMTGWYALFALVMLILHVLCLLKNYIEFKKKLLIYVRNLNKYALHNRGLHFYYAPSCFPCMGKDIATLGICRYDPYNPSANIHLDEDE